MTERVKRYTVIACYGHDGETPDWDAIPTPTGEWCRYEPRFDAPQLSRLRDELPGETRTRLVETMKLITRLRAQPQASPWVPCSERMPGEPPPNIDGEYYWVTDGEQVCMAQRLNPKPWGYLWSMTWFTPTHWAPIIRPEPPQTTAKPTEKP